MGYYIRAFCKAKSTPTIGEILAYLNKDNKEANTGLSVEELSKKDWTDFELFYDKDKLPILVEINRAGDSNGLAKEEIQEFIEFVGKPRLLDTKKKKVIKHLKETQYIICNQMPMSDISGEGEEFSYGVLRFFESNFDGIVQDDRGIIIDEKFLIQLNK